MKNSAIQALMTTLYTTKLMLDGFKDPKVEVEFLDAFGITYNFKVVISCENDKGTIAINSYDVSIDDCDGTCNYQNPTRIEVTPDAFKSMIVKQRTTRDFDVSGYQLIDVDCDTFEYKVCERSDSEHTSVRVNVTSMEVYE